jgi:hypothetical protein
MDSPAIITLIKMMETLPESDQIQVVEAVREYIADLQDEVKWDNTFYQTQDKLAKAARKARKQIREKNVLSH